MQKNKIIKASTVKVPCNKSIYVILPRINGVLLFDGKKTKFISAEEFVDISKEPEVFWDQVNFPHLSDVMSKIDITHELYQEPIVNIKSKDFEIENSETLFGDVEIGFISYLFNIFRKFQRILMILFLIILVSVLMYIIYFCRKPIKSLKNRLIRKRSQNVEVNVATTECEEPLTYPSAPTLPTIRDMEYTANILRAYIK